VVRFELVTLDGVKFGEEVYEILLPTMEGQIGVLTDHMPLISVVTTGVIAIRRKPGDPDDFMEYFAVHGGVLEVENNTLRVLVDEADHEDELNEAEAQKAYELAQKMKTEAKDQVSLEHAQSLVDRHAVRLQVAGLKRNRRTRR
jgi:F-type H+-transporting ATPase subunit epsilon